MNLFPKSVRSIFSLLKKGYSRLKKINVTYNQLMSLQDNYSYLIKHADITKLKPAVGYFRKRQLEILNFTKFFFEEISELNIKPFLVAGNLIGAVRHEGFIPWDDDIDFGLIREEYNKLYNYCKNKYVVIEMESESVADDYNFRSLCLRQYSEQIILFVYHNQIQISYGNNLFDEVWIDFFPFDIFSNDYSFDEYNLLFNDCVKRIHKMNMHDARIFLSKKVADVLEKNIGGGEKVYFGLDSGLNEIHLNQNSDFIKYNCIFPLKKIKYEDTEFYAPSKPFEYLKYEYKDFMTFPTSFFAHHIEHPLLINALRDNYLNIGIFVRSIDEVRLFKEVYNFLRKNNVYTVYVLSKENEDYCKIDSLCDELMLEKTFNKNKIDSFNYVIYNQIEMPVIFNKKELTRIIYNPISQKRGKRRLYLFDKDLENLDKSEILFNIIKRNHLLNKKR